MNVEMKSVTLLLLEFSGSSELVLKLATRKAEHRSAVDGG